MFRKPNQLAFLIREVIIGHVLTIKPRFADLCRNRLRMKLKNFSKVLFYLDGFWHCENILKNNLNLFKC